MSSTFDVEEFLLSEAFAWYSPKVKAINIKIAKVLAQSSTNALVHASLAQMDGSTHSIVNRHVRIEIINWFKDMTAISAPDSAFVELCYSCRAIIDQNQQAAIASPQQQLTTFDQFVSKFGMPLVHTSDLLHQVEEKLNISFSYFTRRKKSVIIVYLERIEDRDAFIAELKRECIQRKWALCKYIYVSRRVVSEIVTDYKEQFLPVSSGASVAGLLQPPP